MHGARNVYGGCQRLWPWPWVRYNSRSHSVGTVNHGLMVTIANRARMYIWYHPARMSLSLFGRTTPPPIPWMHLLHYTDGWQRSKLYSKSPGCYWKTLLLVPSASWNGVWDRWWRWNWASRCRCVIMLIYGQGRPYVNRRHTTTYLGRLFTERTRE